MKIVGQSTERPWTRRSIPNLNVDFDEFVDDQRIGGFEHLRFNNGQVGSIFRERVTLELYARLKYPRRARATAGSRAMSGARTSPSPTSWSNATSGAFASTGRTRSAEAARTSGSSSATSLRATVIPGGPGAVGSVFDDPNICEFSECDNTRGRQLEAAVRETPLGDGFKAGAERLDPLALLPPLSVPLLGARDWRRRPAQHEQRGRDGARRRPVPVPAVLRGHQPGPRVVPDRPAARHELDRSWLPE